MPRTNSTNIYFFYKECLSVIAGRDEISKYVKKLQKGVAKLFDKRFSIDVSDGGEKTQCSAITSKYKAPAQHSTVFTSRRNGLVVDIQTLSPKLELIGMNHSKFGRQTLFEDFFLTKWLS